MDSKPQTFGAFCTGHYECVTSQTLEPFVNANPTDVIVHDEIDYHYTLFYDFSEFKEAFDAYRAYMLERGEHPHLHETLRANVVQCVRIDVDCPDVNSVSARDIEDFDEDLRDAIIEIYERDSVCPEPIEREDFIACFSHGQQKLSMHLITPIYGNGSAACDNFFRALVALLKSRGHPFVKYLDLNVHKRIQDFRLPLCSKRGSNRVKQLPPRTYWDSAMIGDYTNDPIIHLLDTDEVMNNAIRGRECLHPMNYSIIEKMLADKVDNFESTWRLRNECDGVFSFIRLRPSDCDICGREHMKDHTLYVTVSNSGKRAVFVHCRRSLKKGKCVGYLSPEIVEEAKRDILMKILADDSGVDELAIADAVEIDTLVRDNNMRLMTFDEPTLKPFPVCHTLFVRAQMKMGKTKELIEHITKTRPRTVVFVSFRVTFTSSVMDRLASSGYNFERYSDIKSRINIEQHPYVIVQVDSLHRLDNYAKVDLLVLDECESVLAQFTSPHIGNLSRVYTPFAMMMRKAKHVIAMDANLGERTLRITRELRPRTNRLGVEDCVYYNATCRNALGDVYKYTTSLPELADDLLSRIRDGKKVVFVTNSVENAKAIYTAIKNDYRDMYDYTRDNKHEPSPGVKRIAMYTSKTSPTLRERHFRDVHEHWSKLDVLIYTPTVTAGISFELRHFDVVYGSFTSMSCDVETSRQMLGRIRDVSERTYVIHLNIAVAEFPTERKTIAMLLEDVDAAASQIGVAENHIPIIQVARNDGVASARLPYFDLVVENVRHHNMSRNNFADRFINQVRETGATVSAYTAPDEQGHDVSHFFVAQQLAAEYDEEIAVKVVASEPLDDEAFEVVKLAKQGRFDEDTVILERDLHAYTKRLLMQVYEVRAETITPPFYMRFAADKTMHAFMILRDFRGAIKYLAIVPECTVRERYETLRATYKKREDSFSKSTRMLKHAYAVHALTALGIDYIGQRHADKISIADLDIVVDAFIATMKTFTGDLKTSINMLVQHEFNSSVRDRRQAMIVCCRHFGLSLRKKKDEYVLMYDVELLHLYATRDFWAPSLA